jgi:hypothetical protein
MRFMVNQKEYRLEREDVEKRMRGILPEPIAKYYIVVRGRNYPPKQVLSIVSKIDRIELTTMGAHEILKRLGFDLRAIWSNH